MTTTRARIAFVVGLLALMTAFGIQAVSSTPEGGRAIGVWPVALATSCLMLSRRPALFVLPPVIGALAVLSIHLGGRPLDVSVGMGIGLVLEALVTWRVLTRGQPGRAPLETSQDLARFLLAVVAGASAMAVAGGVTSLVTGYGDPRVTAVAVASSGLAAQLTLLPFFCRFRRHPPQAGPVERLAQWAVLLAVTLAVFLPPSLPSMVMLVLPALAWGALRSGSYEAMAQVAVVFGLSMPLTTLTAGPFSRPDLRFGVPVDLQGILLATFGTVCALIVLTLTMTVGDQREWATQVEAERDRIRSIVDGASSIAIIGADLEGRITLFNPGAQRLLGYSPVEVLGLRTRVLHPEEGVVAKADELGVARDFGVVAGALVGQGATEMPFVRKDGVVRLHQMTLDRVVDGLGRPTGFVSTSEDVTDRLEAEGRMVEALDTERRAVERLREVDRVKDAFVSSVSHELRTPLTSILGYTEMLTEGGYGALEPRQLDALGRIGTNSERLLSLIGELLTISRVEDRGLRTADLDVDLNEVVAAGLAVLAPVLSTRSLDLEVDLPDHPVAVRGDREMLERVVLNLADNAVKFTRDGGRVDVTLAQEAGCALLQVTDTGIGVPSGEQERLFDRFFRSSLAQHHAIPGSGLGLSIAHTIVQRHGGTMEFCSEAGVGTTFRVRLPAA